MPKKIVILQNRFSYNILQFHIGYCILNSATYFIENIDRKSAPFFVLIFRPEPQSPALSEQEFEEIFQRNKTVSSSAISRAVQDASAGRLITCICIHCTC